MAEINGQLWESYSCVVGALCKGSGGHHKLRRGGGSARGVGYSKEMDLLRL